MRESHPEQRTAAVCHRQWHERARQPCAQLSASLECGAQPIAAGHPPGPTTLGASPVLVQGPDGGPKPINTKGEMVGTLPTFRDAYRTRRCIVPVDGFFLSGRRSRESQAVLRHCDEGRIAVRSCRHLGEPKRTRLQVNRFGLSPSSPPIPMNWLPRSMTACR